MSCFDCFQRTWVRLTAEDLGVVNFAHWSVSCGGRCLVDGREKVGKVFHVKRVWIIRNWAGPGSRSPVLRGACDIWALIGYGCRNSPEVVKIHRNSFRFSSFAHTPP